MRSSDDMPTSTHSNPSSCHAKFEIEHICDEILNDPLEESFAAMSVVIDGQQLIDTGSTRIQSMMRGCLQRWRYLIAVKESEVTHIRTLQTKQEKKIRERTQKTKQWLKKRQEMDTTKEQRQLTRAKKVIKFLMKEEKRQKKENTELLIAISKLEADNQTLTTDTQLQREIEIDALNGSVAEMEQQQRQLAFDFGQYEVAIAAMKTELVQLETQIQQLQHCEVLIQQCISSVQEKAQDCLLPAAHINLTVSDGMQRLTIVSRKA